uniref:Uncharacterized protein n=1 Tax=Oryza glumipatula TaxID=40148 RepID=A0A0E0B844_9ORYZ
MGLCRRDGTFAILVFPMALVFHWQLCQKLRNFHHKPAFARTPPIRRKASACSATITVATANVHGNVKLNDLPSHIILHIMSFTSMCQAGHACVLCCQISGVPSIPKNIKGELKERSFTCENLKIVEVTFLEEDPLVNRLENFFFNSGITSLQINITLWNYN